MNSLPSDILFSVLHKVDFATLGKIACCSKDLNKICSSYDFWNRRYFAEFSQYLPTNDSNWKRVYMKTRQLALKNQLKDSNEILWNRMSENIQLTFRGEAAVDTIYYDITENLANNYFKIDYGKKDWTDTLINLLLGDHRPDSLFDIDDIILDAIDNNNVLSSIPIDELVKSLNDHIKEFRHTCVPIAHQIRDLEHKSAMMCSL